MQLERGSVTWPTSLKAKTIAREVMIAFIVPSGVYELNQLDEDGDAAFVDAKRTKCCRMFRIRWLL